MAAQFNNRSHERDIEIATRTNAFAALGDVSDLTNERRERAALVASAINRGAPAAETDARKLAYDEAYIRWNARVPGDLLRVRSALQLNYQPLYEGYIDALTNVDALKFADDPDKLLRNQQNSHQSGLFSKMDVCITRAYDSYRANGYDFYQARGLNILTKAQKILKACNFPTLYSRSIFCFSTISESLYRSISAFRTMKTAKVSKEEVTESCTPP